ncbi:MAG TPA: hypothetical protein VGG59_11060 [Acidobacteriaceae bacterium]|jgi:hypothetical protein
MLRTIPIRTIPIFVEGAHPPVWSGRMSAGEFAVLCEDARTGAAKQPDNTLAPAAHSQVCTIFDSRQAAEEFARERVAVYPAMRCLVFDHEGRAGRPLLIVNRPEFAPRGEIGPVFRRWVGGICLVAGLALGAWEIAHDYATIWAGALAIRLLPVAVVFLGSSWCSGRRANGPANDSARQPAPPRPLRYTVNTARNLNQSAERRRDPYPHAPLVPAFYPHAP